MSVRLHAAEGGFDIFAGDVLVIRHRADAPALFVGAGSPRVDMYRGNYFLEDKLAERVALREVTIAGDRVTLSAGGRALLALTVRNGALACEALDPALNRLSSASGAAASNCPMSTWQGGAFPCGRPSRASGATSRR